MATAIAEINCFMVQQRASAFFLSNQEVKIIINVNADSGQTREYHDQTFKVRNNSMMPLVVKAKMEISNSVMPLVSVTEMVISRIKNQLQNLGGQMGMVFVFLPVVQIIKCLTIEPL